MEVSSIFNSNNNSVSNQNGNANAIIKTGDVRFETSMGNIDIELYWNHAPLTCANFRTLTERGYYNKCIFHRIIPNFVIQGGDPTATGRGGNSIYGGNFKDEIHPHLRHTGAGVIVIFFIFFFCNHVSCFLHHFFLFVFCFCEFA